MFVGIYCHIDNLAFVSSNVPSLFILRLFSSKLKSSGGFSVSAVIGVIMKSGMPNANNQLLTCRASLCRVISWPINVCATGQALTVSSARFLSYRCMYVFFTILFYCTSEYCCIFAFFVSSCFVACLVLVLE